MCAAAQARAQGGAGDANEPADEEGADDPMQYAPRPETLGTDTFTTTASMRQDNALANGATAHAAGMYRPPRINPTTMEGDEDDDPDKDRGKRSRRAELERARRAARSDVVRHLAAEVAGAPDEVGVLALHTDVPSLTQPLCGALLPFDWA